MSNLSWGNVESFMFESTNEPYSENQLRGLFESAVGCIQRNIYATPSTELNTTIENQIYAIEKAIEKIKLSSLSNKERRIFWLKELEQKFRLNVEPPSGPNGLKLIWNGQKNALCDIFRQLKNIHNSKNEPLISNSYDEIAHFLKLNFDCFESNELSTIVGMLKKDHPKLKQSNKIEIKCLNPEE